MTVFQDTREKPGQHTNIEHGLAARGIQIVRTKLYVGDYTRMDCMTTCVDMKQDLQEVYSNLIQQHERFRAECQRAQENGIRLVVLVEEPGIESIADVAKWENPRLKKYEIMKAKGRTNRKPPTSSKALKEIMVSMTVRYGVQWMFCRKEESAQKICEILKIET